MTTDDALSHREVLARFEERHPTLDSAAKIVGVGDEQTFVERYGPGLAGRDREARRVYRTAIDLQERAVLLWANLRDAASPYLGQTLFDNLPTELPKAFLERQASVPRYERLFGDLDVPECEHHRSIFGPAAYFVDLMRFVERNIAGRNGAIPLACGLESRRPDLSRIRLDADNTGDLVAHIDLVNELLEAFVGGTRDAGGDAYGLLRETVFPMSLPFDLPLAEVRRYLEAFGTSLHDVHRTFRPFAVRNERALERLLERESLGLSAEEAELIVAEVSDPVARRARLAALYGMEPTDDDALPTGRDGLENVDVFLDRTGLTRERLNELLFHDLDRHEVNAGLSRPFFVNDVDDGLGHLGIATDITRPDAPYERLLNLSEPKLDRIHRFLRLARKLDWSFADLDRALRSLAPAHVAETALHFDGVNDYVTCGPLSSADDESGPSLPMDGSFTLEAWIEPARGGRHAILSRGGRETDRPRFLLWIDAHDRLSLHAEAAGEEPIELHGVRPIPARVFTHVAVVVSNPEGTVRLVVDGEADRVATLPRPLGAHGERLEIGRDLNDLFFGGVIKEVRIWNEARSLEDIARDRYRPRRRFGALPNVPNLIGYWPLVESVDDVLNDLSAGGHHGRSGGEEFVTRPRWVRRDLMLDPLPRTSGESRREADHAPVPEDTERLLPEPPFATRATVLELDGENDVIVVKNDRNRGLGRLDRWTLEFWFDATRRDKRASRRQVLFTQGDAEAGVCVYLHERRLHVLEWCDDFGGGAFRASRLRQDTALDHDTWHHLAITHDEFPDAAASPPRDEIELRAYLDGVPLVAADGAEHAAGFRLSPVGPFCLGGLASGRITAFEDGPSAAGEEDEHFYGGRIAELRLWRTVRATDAPMRERAVAPEPSRDLLAYLPLDEGEGWLVDDPAGERHGNRHAGTLQRRQIVLRCTRNDPGLLGIHSHYDKPEALEWTNYRYAGRLRIGGAKDAIGVTFLSRHGEGIDQYYRLSRDADHPAFRLIAHPAGVQTLKSTDPEGDGTVSGLEPKVNRWYRFLVGVEDTGTRTTIRAKIWPDGDDEPADDQIDAYDDDPDIRITAGTVGVWTDGTGDEARQFDDLCTWPNAVTDPTPAELWLDIDFEDDAQLPEPAHWRDTGDRVVALDEGESFGRLETDEAGGRAVWGTRSTLPNLHAHYAAPGVDTTAWRDYTYEGQMRVTDAAGGIGVTFLCRHGAEGDRHYSLRRDADRPAFHLAARPHGVQPLRSVSAVESLESDVVPLPDTWYRFAVETSSDPVGKRTRIRAKVWAAGTEEPAAFQMVAHDESGIRLETGTVGVWATGPGAKHFDRLDVAEEPLLAESFDAYAPARDPSGWRDTDRKNSRVEEPELFKTALVDGDPVFGTTSTEVNIHSHYARPDALDWKNYAYTGRLCMTHPGSGIGVTFLSRYPDDAVESGQHDHYYRLRSYPGRRAFHIAPHRGDGKAGAPLQEDGANEGIVPEPKRWYRFHVEVEDTGARTRIRANVWPESQSEPARFQIDVHDDSPDRLTRGTVGFWSGMRGEKYFDDLRVVQGLLLSGSDGAEAFESSPSRHRDEPDDELFEAVDTQDNELRWKTIDTFPVLRRPLGRRALRFDGERQALAGVVDPTLALGDLTIEAWIRPEPARANPVVALEGTVDGEGMRIALSVDAEGRPVLAAGGTTLVGPVAIPATDARERFVHVAARVRGTAVTLLVDGHGESPADTPAEPLSLPAPLELQLGGIELGRSPDPTHFAGSIKEVRLWSTARTDEQIVSGRHQRPDESSTALLGYWPLGEDPDPAIGRGPRATALGPIVPSVPPPIGIALEDGGFWRARRRVLAFDGTLALDHDDPDTSPRELHRRTIEVCFLVRDKRIASRKQVIYHEGDWQRGLVIYVHDGALHFVGYNAPAGESGWRPVHEENWQVRPRDRRRVWRLGSERIESGRWHHVALVLDGRDEVRPDALRAFIDGKAVLTGPGSRSWRRTGGFSLGGVSGTVRFHDHRSEEAPSFDGASTGIPGHALDGAILYLRLWSRARDAGEIAADRARDIETPREHLELSWNFDSTDGTRVVDASGNGRDGRLDRVERLQTLHESLRHVPPYAFAPIALDDGTLGEVAAIKRLKDERGQSVEQLTALWSDLDHVGRGNGPTFFDRVFNRQVEETDAWHPHADRPVRWDRSGQEDRDRDRRTRSRLMQSLGLSSADLDALVTHLSGDEIVVEMDTSYLTRLYRLARLPRVLRMTVAELPVLLGHLQRRSVETLADVTLLSERADWLRRTGLSVAELVFFGKDVGTEHAELYAADDLRGLARSLGKQRADILVGDDAFTTTSITEAQSLAVFESLLAIGRLEIIGVGESAPDATGQLPGRLAAVKATGAAGVDSALDGLLENLAGRERWTTELGPLEAELDVVRKGLGRTVRDALVSGGLVNESGLVDHRRAGDLDDATLLSLFPAADRRKAPVRAKLGRLREWLEARLARQAQILAEVSAVLARFERALPEAVVQGLADLFEVSADLVGVVLEHLRRRGDAVDAVAFVERMHALDAVDSPIPLDLSVHVAKVVKLLYLLSRFELDTSEARAFLDRPEVLLAPADATGPARATDLLRPDLTDLDRLERFRRLKAEFEDRNGRLIELLGEDGVDLSALDVDEPRVRRIAALTGWEPRQLIALASALGGREHNRVDVLSRLKAGFDLARSMGCDIDFLIRLAEPGASDVGFRRRQASALLQVLRAHVGDDDWERVHEPIRDELAVRRRDALLAVAMQRLPADFGGRRGPDVLSEYFLLDLQTGSEVDTSRIVQATASLQLYVQRCLMNLEAGVDPATIPRPEWEWVRNYRVWEANRKVFLYPENYIEPELRRGKSPLFEELENNLAQVDIDQAAVEKAYVAYLDRFSELARLKIVGSYLHRDLPGDPEPGNETLYLIGRSDTQPRLYHLREHVKTPQGERWLPWRKIDVAINADTATPVHAFGKLLLFWVEFTKLKESRDRLLGEGGPGSFVVTFIKPFLEGKLLPTSHPGFAASQPWVRAALMAYGLVEEEITRLERGDWSIDKEGYLYDTRIVGRVQRNVDVYKAEVKYSYYNFDGNWIPPQLYTVKTLSDTEYRDVRWHSLYAQRTRELDPAAAPPRPPRVERAPKVLQIDDTTRLAILVPRSRTDRITWSFWVKRSNGVARGRHRGSSAPDRQEVTLLDYGNGGLRVTAISEFTAIAGAREREDRVRSAVSGLAEVLGPSDPARFDEAADALTRIRSTFATAIDGPDDATGWNAYVTSIRAAFAPSDPAIAALQGAREARERQAPDAAGKRQDFETRWRAAAPSIRDALDLSNAQLGKETGTPRWESGTWTLALRPAGAGSPFTVTLEMDHWQHVALRLERTGDRDDGYAVTLIRHRHGADGDERETSGFLRSPKLEQRALVEIGKQLAADPLFGTQLAELRLWSRSRSTAEIAAERLRRRPSGPGLTSLPLNEPVESSIMTLVDAPELTFTTPVAFAGAVSERLAGRERVIIFHGDEIRSIRDNLEEQGFTLTSVPQGSGQSYDVSLTRSPSGPPTEAALSLIRTDGLFVSDAVRSTGDGSTLTRSGSVLPGATSRESALASGGDAAERVILGKLTSREVIFLDVHNRPGWYVVDTGDDQFLMQSFFLDARGDELPVPTAAELMKVEFDDESNRPDSATQAISVTFELDPTRAPAVAPAARVAKVEFRFERLSTHAIHALGKNLFTGGIDKFLAPASQRSAEIDFWQAYEPDRTCVPESRNRVPATIDFEGSCRLYFEELFFHIPFLIANRLNASQRFADAQKWYHYIFDPTAAAPDADAGASGNPNDRYWRYLPFRDRTPKRLAELLTQSEALAAYREDPFDPHAIAALRLTTYQKAVVMKYIDNLLDWGDSLFARDTRESITEATLLYVMAFNLLGPRPAAGPPRRRDEIGTYDRFVESHADDVEFFTELERTSPAGDGGTAVPGPNAHLITHFCVPENAKFAGYWDLVEDRLYKVRHSLNIEGVFRELALFQPPIDPAALVAAVARGGGIGGALADLGSSVPHYRHGPVLRQAKEVTAIVGELGGALLAALESRDEGQLAVLQHTHERNLLELVTTVKAFELSEAQETLEALQINRLNVDNRREHYRGLVEDGTAGLSLSAAEASAITFRNAGRGVRVGVGITKILAKMVKVTPTINLGASGFGASPVATTSLSGDNLSAVLEAQGAAVGFAADTLDIAADMSQEIGEYQRRLEEWKHERASAELDLQEIDLQILAARTGLARIEHEQRIHERELRQNREIGDFMRGKFTNGELRGWMVARLSELHFQGYRLAHDLAKAAEKALQFELPTTQTFVTPGHWDNLRKGLLAADSLMLELNRMDKVRLDQDSRFQEIEKTISMKRTFPEAFALLGQTGSCEFSLGERLFDLDFPGHYCRLVKTVALSVVVDGDIDPFDAVHASLSQSGNKTLLVPDSAAVAYLLGIGDERPDTSTLRINWRANQQIAISKASEDLGMFNLDFVFDDRYFPFEGTGAVSTWQLEMPLENNPTLAGGRGGQLRIGDVIVHLRYTSKFDRGAFRQEVRAMMR